jgi:hypothetical protein
MAESVLPSGMRLMLTESGRSPLLVVGVGEHERHRVEGRVAEGQDDIIGVALAADQWHGFVSVMMPSRTSSPTTWTGVT